MKWVTQDQIPAGVVSFTFKNGTHPLRLIRLTIAALHRKLLEITFDVMKSFEHDRLTPVFEICNTPVITPTGSNPVGGDVR